ncbi:hypothetical protein JOQ06_013756 [Pogonophryne albipinna]|uniref:Uncharacterized protein n=1 Tax=Pogonophryne albipinna TaxID=1090488 RepID=A0AAD6BJH6_9TELE|nr:hypothetical protein JOQ06_013756 [Pogonophryne albipinna]
MLALEATCATLTDSNVKLLAKVTDLESRSRRNNIRIVGLPESIEGPHPSTFFPKLLMEVFGEGVLDSPPECDRAHRSLTDKPKPGQRPRPVIIRVHRYQQKENIIREARARRGKLQYQGTPIYEDYTPEVMEQHYKYREVECLWLSREMLRCGESDVTRRQNHFRGSCTDPGEVEDSREEI